MLIYTHEGGDIVINRFVIILTALLCVGTSSCESDKAISWDDAEISSGALDLYAAPNLTYATGFIANEHSGEMVVVLNWGSQATPCFNRR